ncbi:hypothetical protein MOF27_20000 [Priestia megaterium]|uniref:hypothetical protein n=1 Tax=Priestia megaterium TaxID=1404 RepID=UPI002282C861|nr:hypothetical protein [Priestia megaterium]MCY9019695.1 hypothetical protein [Priestia megaterium]
MKEAKQIIEELIDVQIGYYNDRREIKKYLEDQPVILAMLESYTERIDCITEIILDDILEVPNEPSVDKYNKRNWYKRVVEGLIDYTIRNDGKYKDSAIELIMDWENISSSIEKLDSRNWYYHENLLHEHSEGFPTYQKKLEEEEKEKKKRTKKTTA